MKLPEDIQKAVQPLFDKHPLDGALLDLVVAEGAPPEQIALVEQILADPALQGKQELAAGLWLYVDELDRSHRISQKIDTATGAFWHAIMHRREGDFANSHHWYNVTGSHPAMADMGHFDPHAFVDEVELRHDKNPTALVECQQKEWKTLFEWCARNV